MCRQATFSIKEDSRNIAISDIVIESHIPPITMGGGVVGIGFYKGGWAQIGEFPILFRNPHLKFCLETIYKKKQPERRK